MKKMFFLATATVALALTACDKANSCFYNETANTL